MCALTVSVESEHGFDDKQRFGDRGKESAMFGELLNVCLLLNYHLETVSPPASHAGLIKTVLSRTR
jgi:hypothetical protein